MTRYSPGDLVEIRTTQGLAYVQVSHDHPSYPPVIRALPGHHARRPVDLDALVQGASSFKAMIPLASALDRLGVKHEALGRLPIPEAERDFPTFRMPIRDRQGRIVYWWFWDGDTLRYDADPAEGQDGLPVREVMSADRFLARLAGAAESA